MDKTKTRESILVSLDSILDTRLGTLSLIDSAIVEKILLSGTYHTRDEDVFEGIDKEAYKKLYNERDIDTLANSVLTNIPELIRHLIKVMADQAISRPLYEGSEVIVNVYPYKLSADEQEDIRKAISIHILDIAPVSIVSYSPKDLTPPHCKNTYAMMIMYDYEEWLNAHAEAFNDVQLPDVALFVPAIYFANKPSDEELKKVTKETMHPLQALETLAKVLVGLNLIDVKHFSIISK